ncbi:MAG: PQQ-dependent sugar dehydrogenase [Thermoanaerobaculia bacterium]
MRSILSAITLLLLAVTAESATLPGFRIERLGDTEGFPSSLAIDSRGNIYYTTTEGSMYRFFGSGSLEVATVPTDAGGNSGLLGMALIDDQTAAVHYTTPLQTHDVVSTIDLRNGSETVLHRFVADIEVPGRPSPSEHHGGNPTVAADGSIFVGIGDYSWQLIAPDPAWNGGKIFRITRDGLVTQYARGVRNPFDMAWDDEQKRLIVADNGPTGGDEIDVISDNVDLGWPHTYGTLPPVAGATPPDYVFPMTVAPTGMTLLNGANPYLRSGFLLGAFVTRAIYFFPDATPPVEAPLALVEKETSQVIDVAQRVDGAIFFATGGFSAGTTAIYRLHTPQPGDCNGDGVVTGADRDALTAELQDGAMQRTIAVQEGLHRSSWGCDADLDGFVTAADAVEISRLQGWRRRAVRP